MFHDPDIDAVGLKFERELVRKRAEFRGPLLDAARRSQPAPKPAPVAPVGARCGRLTNVLGFFRRGRRPAMA
jgi:hypothetical protein